MQDPSLAQILAQRMQAGDPIPVPVVLGVVCQVCDALHAGHSVNALHTNVAPHNIFIAANGVVGMAAPGPQPQATPAYAAPEYVMMGMLDARADLWSLGVVAYEMLANRPLFFAGDDRATIDRVCGMMVQPPSAMNPIVPPDVDAIVMNALVRDPSHRWQYAIVLRDQIFATAQRLGIDISPAQIAAWLAAPMRPSAPAVQPRVQQQTPQPSPALLETLPAPQSQPSAFGAPGTSSGTKPMPAPEPPSFTAPMPTPEPLPNVTKPMPAPDRPPAGSKTTQDVWQDDDNEETRMDTAPTPPEPGPFAKAPSAPRSAQPPPRVTKPSPLAVNLPIASGPLVDPKSPLAEAKTVLGDPSPIARPSRPAVESGPISNPARASIPSIPSVPSGPLVDPKSPAAEAKTVLGEQSPLAKSSFPSLNPGPLVDPKSPAAEAKTVFGDPVPAPVKPLSSTLLGATPPAEAKTLFQVESPIAAKIAAEGSAPAEALPNVDSAPIAVEVAGQDSAPIAFEVAPPDSAPVRAPTPAPMPEPAHQPPLRLNTQMFMVGGEATQIGAKPLVDFGDSGALSSLVGPQHRPSGPVIPSNVSPAPKGTSVAPETTGGGKKLFVIIGVLVVVLGAAAAVVVMYVL